jgi:hypothetical protein
MGRFEKLDRNTFSLAEVYVRARASSVTYLQYYMYVGLLRGSQLLQFRDSPICSVLHSVRRIISLSALPSARLYSRHDVMAIQFWQPEIGILTGSVFPLAVVDIREQINHNACYYFRNSE